MNATSPQISGMNIAADYIAAWPGSGMESDLLARRGERPSHVPPALLAEREPQLAWWPQPVRMVRTEGRARALLADRAELVLMKEAALAARFGHAGTTLRHPLFTLSVGIRVRRENNL